MTDVNAGYTDREIAAMQAAARPMTDTTLTDTELTTLDGGIREWEDNGGPLLNALKPAVERIVAARVADRDTWWRERIEARDQEWQRHLDMLPNEMAEAWGGDAAWLTTGSKVATLVGDWLGDLHYDLTPLAAEARTQGGAS